MTAAAGDALSPALRLGPSEAVRVRARHNASASFLTHAAQVYDCCWYPGARAAEPASCLFAATSRAHPLQLWDAVSGALRATYRCGPYAVPVRDEAPHARVLKNVRRAAHTTRRTR